MSDEWGPWIEHDGKGCRCVGAYVRYVGVCSRGQNYVGEAACQPGEAWLACFDWSKAGRVIGGAVVTRILRYRIRRPKALREMIDRAESLPVVAPKRVEPAGPLEVM